MAALNEIEVVCERVENIKSEKTRIAEALLSSGFDVIPGNANFLMTAVSGGDHLLADRLAEHLFDQAGIVVNQTREAGLERFIRFSMSTRDNNDLLLHSLRTFVQNNS